MMKAHWLVASSRTGYASSATGSAIPNAITLSKGYTYSHRPRIQCAISSKEDYVLAIDVGTSGTKAALVSSNGNVAFSAFAAHPAPTSSSQGGQASSEQDPCSWWLATKSAVNTCLSQLNHPLGNTCIQALAVTGQMQDVIFVPKVDIHHQRKAILYSDARATLEATEVSNMAGGEDHLAYLTGAKQGATSLLAKLRWLDRHQPRAFVECQSVLIGGSPIWSVILANIFGKTVDVLEDAQNVGVKGAAILAGKWLGWHDTLSPSGDWLRIKTSISPCPESTEKYQELFEAYKTAYLGLRETFRLLAKYTAA